MRRLAVKHFLNFSVKFKSTILLICDYKNNNPELKREIKYH